MWCPKCTCEWAFRLPSLFQRKEEANAGPKQNLRWVCLKSTVDSFSSSCSSLLSSSTNDPNYPADSRDSSPPSMIILLVNYPSVSLPARLPQELQFPPLCLATRCSCPMHLLWGLGEALKRFFSSLIYPFYVQYETRCS